MTTRCVALLRGINVGSAKRVAMADLRRIVAGLGYDDPRTLLNSGNVVFGLGSGTAREAGARIEQAIATELGVTTRVVALKGRDLAAAVAANPLAHVATDPARLQVLVCGDPKALARLKPLEAEDWTPEALVVAPRVAWLWCAGGVADSRLGAAVHRLLGDQGTARNLATMMKIVALVEGR